MEYSMLDEKKSTVSFLENALEIDIICRDNDNLFDRLSLVPFYEEGSTDGESKSNTDAAKNGIMMKIQSGIKTLIDKIQAILNAAIRAISNFGKERLTYDKYKNSEAGSAELEKRINKIKQEIDNTFLDARPVVKMISNVFKMDPKTVSNKCDAVIEHIGNLNWGEGIRMMMSYGHERLAATKGYQKELSLANDRLDKSLKDLSNSKDNLSDKQARFKALNDTGKMLAKMTSALFGGLARKDNN